MAEATTADIIEVQKETLKKVTVIGNILGKNLVPPSQRKEQENEANQWKKKLFGFLSGIAGSLGDLVGKVVKVGKFPIAIIFALITFLMSFFGEIMRQLGKLKKIGAMIKGIPKAIEGIFLAIRGALTALREGVAARLAKALAAFRESKAFKLIASGLDDLRDAYRMARESVVLKIKNALAAFKEHKAVKAIGGAFTRMRMLLNAGKLHIIGVLKGALTAFKENAVVKAIGGAFGRMRMLLNAGKLHVIGLFRSALAIFKESPVIKAIGGAFKTIGGFFGSAIGVGKGAGATAKTGGIIGAVKGAMATFKGSAVFKAIAGISKILTGAFAGILSLVGAAGKALGPAGKFGVGAGKGIIGALSKVAGVVKSFAGFTGITKFAAGFGRMLGKLLWPITIIIGVFDFIKGFRKDKGWEGQDATLFDKIGMGIEEALVGLIGLPLDMIKNVVAWILGKFGIGKTIDPETGKEVESGWMTAMKEFSFSDLIRSIWQGLWTGLGAAIDWIIKLFTDPVATLKEAGGAILTAFSNFGKWLWDNSIGKVWTWITDFFGWSEPKEEGPPGTTKKVGVWGFIKGIPGKIWEWIKGIVLGWFGIASADEKITTTIDEGTKPEAGWLATLFAKIFPEWLTSPVKWAMKKLGLADDAGVLTDKGSVLSEKLKTGGGIGTLISDLFVKIFPEWLTSPLKWAMKKLGLTDDSGVLTDAGSELSETVKTGGISGMIGAIFKKIFPEWLTSPVTWAMKKLGLTDASGVLTDKGSTLSEAVKTGGLGALIGDLFAKIFPEWITSPIVWIKKKIFGTGEEKLTDPTADSFFADWKLPTWDSFKEMLPQWLRDPVGWVKGLFKKGDEAGQAERDARELKAGAKSRIGITQTSLGETKASLAGMTDAGEARRFDIDAAAKVKRYALEDEIKKEQDELAGGDVKGGMIGFQYKREDRIKELQTELGAVNTQEQTDLAQSQLADTAEIKRLTDLQVELETQLAADQRIMTTDLATLVKEATAPSESLRVHDVHLERLLLPMVDNVGALLTAFGGQGKTPAAMTVNNVSVSPNTTASVASTTITENVYGTTDPFTAVAGAYG